MTESTGSAAVALDARAVVVRAGPCAGRRPLRAGAMHYFRVEPRAWGACLRALRDIGFTFVDTAVPWGLHERAPGRLDFGGPRDLGAFLDACAGEGLGVLLRVGPRVGAELPYAGLPERIAGNPALVARTAQGDRAVALEPVRAFAPPSYACRAFLDEVGGYYRALAEVVGPRLAPAGAVVLVQLDHELGGFLRAGPFCGDYHPDALARYLDEEGGAPARDAPRGAGADVVPALRWLAFRERQITAALASLAALAESAGLLRPRGLGPLRIHGFAALPPVVYDVAAAETVVDVAGTSLIAHQDDPAAAGERARYLAGSSRFPLASPLPIGGHAWGPVLGAEDAVASLLRALLGGVVGWTAHMAVERDRWIGGAVDGRGRPVAAFAEPLARIHRALDEAGWTDLEHRRTVGLLVPREYLRLSLATSHLGPASPLGGWLRLEQAAASDDHFGFQGPIAHELRNAITALAAALDESGADWALVDGSAPQDRLASLRALVVPTFDFLDRGLATRLHEFAGGGGRLLSGPRRPLLDCDLQPAAVALAGSTFDAATLADAALLRAALERLLNDHGDEGPRARAREPGVQVALHHRAGEPALLFVGNSEDRGRTVHVEGAGGGPFIDVLNGQRSDGAELEIELRPRGVCLLRAV